jgi:L-alanine-DL-glutamate epimerase-like enolase superfamily enzyme
VTARITALATRLLRVPLSRPWGPDVQGIGVIEVRVADDDGGTGFGLSWTPSIGASAVRAMLDDDIAPFVVGLPAEPEGWDAVWRHLHEAGGGGVTTIALAGLDTALWDLRARRADRGLAELLGRRHATLPLYGSGVNLHYPLPELQAQARRWVAAGLSAVKIKVGRPELAEDVERVAAVRAILGPDRGLMLDANQRWDVTAAIRGAEALAPFEPDWLEEPLRADDLDGHVELRRHTVVPIAVGENLHTEHRFREYLDAGAADVLQPNVVRVGGITPFLRIAALVQARGARLAPHLLPELSAQVAFALPDPTWIEDVEDARFEQLGALSGPTGLRFADGRVSGGPRRGLGLRFA